MAIIVDDVNVLRLFFTFLLQIIHSSSNYIPVYTHYNKQMNTILFCNSDKTVTAINRNLYNFTMSEGYGYPTGCCFNAIIILTLKKEVTELENSCIISPNSSQMEFMKWQ